jgi:hypothetical protein
MTAKKKKKTCNAKLKHRPGERCGQPAGWGTDHVGEGRCKLHAGSTPRGAASVHYVHGARSRYMQNVKNEIAQKVDAFLDADPFDLTEELALSRGLLEDFLSKIEYPMTDAHRGTAMMLVDRIGKTVERINRIKNDSALTAAEITYLAARAADVVARYIVDPAKQKAFIQDLFGGLAGANSTIPGRLADKEG